MTDEQKGPMWVAFLAGAIVLGTGPLALAFLVIMGSHGEEGGLSGLAQMVNEGGVFSYAVLLGGALASLTSAVLTGISVRRPGLPAPFALIPFLLVSLVGLAGVIFGMREVLSVIGNVAPSDKATIMAGATSEIMSLSVQSLAFAAAGTLCVALAALVSIGSAPRGARVLTFLGAGTLGLCLTLMTFQGLTTRGGFSAIARVSPSDRFTLLAGIVQEWQQLNRFSNGLFIASLFIAIVGGAVLAARKQSAGIGAALTLVVAAIGFRGFNAMAERQLSPVVNLPPANQLKQVDGIEPFCRSTVLHEQSFEYIDRAVILPLQDGAGKIDPHNAWIALELTQNLEVKSVLRVIQTTHLVKAQLELVGSGPKRELVVPPLFDSAVNAMSNVQLAVPVRALFPGEECADCQVATLTEKGLQVGEATWTRADLGLTGEIEKLPGVEIDFPKDLDSLVRASVTALGNQHVLVVRVPMPDPMPRLAD